MVVHFLIQLFAGENRLLGIHDNDIIPGIHVRGENGLILAAQHGGNLAGETAQHNAVRIHDIPFALHVRGFGMYVFKVGSSLTEWSDMDPCGI